MLRRETDVFVHVKTLHSIPSQARHRPERSQSLQLRSPRREDDSDCMAVLCKLLQFVSSHSGRCRAGFSTRWIDFNLEILYFEPSKLDVLR